MAACAGLRERDAIDESVKPPLQRLNFRPGQERAKGGEQAVGNLVFKLLRKRGFIDRLITASRQAYDRALSLSEHAVARELRCVIGEISSWE